MAELAMLAVVAVLLLFEQFYNLWLFKHIVVLYVLYVHCTHVRLSYVINFYLITYLQRTIYPEEVIRQLHVMAQVREVRRS